VTWTVQRHLLALVPGQRAAQVRRQIGHRRAYPVADGLRGRLVERDVDQGEEPGVPFHQSAYGRTVPGAHDAVVDITFATDNFKAGTLIGQWAEKQLAGKPAVIALLDLFNDKIVSVDYNRDQGFLTGMGIDTKDKKKNGDEDKTGKYKDGTYTIVCNEAGNGAEDGGRSAMERCLTKNPDINVVYTINEPTAVGASGALKAQGKTALIVSVDGGCAGVKSVKSGVIGATAQQYPLKMAKLGMEAIKKIATGGEKPKTSEGLDFFDTGVALVTDKKADGVESISSDDGSKICWG